MTRPAKSLLGALATIAVLLAMFSPSMASATPAELERGIEQRGWSSQALLALSSEYDATGDKGRAILALERARLLSPREGAIESALARVRSEAGVSEPQPSRARRAVATLTADEWAWVALGGGLIACMSLVGLAWGHARVLARPSLVVGTVAVVLAGMAATIVAPSSDRAIVVADEVARISPFPAAEPSFEPLEGEAVVIEQERGEFVHVRIGDRTGWLPRTAVERVVPPS
ncbi:MAG: hypothetical protein H0T46_03450 [Deltaproteobacteria bacterium]|nr:hypothetical protein [Deltaproteobacteria bacterium]